MDKIQAIIDIIKHNWSNEEIADAWNLRCDKKDYMDERIEYMDTFDELFCNLKPSEIAEKVYRRDFCTGDDFYAFNGYGNLESFSEVEDYSRFSYEELAEYLVDNGDSLTTDVDTDELLESFIYEYFNDYIFYQIKNTIETYMEDNTFDLLMDNWDDLNEDIRYYIEENGLVDDEEDDISEEDVTNFVNSLLEEDDDEDTNWYGNTQRQEGEEDED